jgi:FtsP/CotA-like multicopper oxidase with cupredoxin domain
MSIKHWHLLVGDVTITMNRRKFIYYGLTGSALLSGGALNLSWLRLLPRAVAAPINISLAIEEVMIPMFNNNPPIYMWAFKSQMPNVPTYTAIDLASDPLNPPPPVPGPVLTVYEGDKVYLSVTNNHAGVNHGFAIAKRPLPKLNPAVLTEPEILIEGPTISPMSRADFSFDAPAAGTYLYFDPLNNPINRIMGLHGAMVVLPTDGSTPYSTPTSAIQHLFRDLSEAEGFFTPDGVPGEKWDMLNPMRNFIWLFNDIDDVHVNIPLQNGVKLSPNQVKDTFLPRYFTINGRTGFPCAHATENALRGHIGEPTLIRCLNAGLASHSPHIHGNHVYELINQLHTDLQLRLAENVLELDTWELQPLVIKDILHAYRKPPDIFPWPPDPAQFGVEGMHFPMHCHIEMSQTAAGGNYPQGAITDWVLLGSHQT